MKSELLQVLWKNLALEGSPAPTPARIGKISRTVQFLPLQGWPGFSYRKISTSI
jgi:hypothetical protein